VTAIAKVDEAHRPVCTHQVAVVLVGDVHTIVGNRKLDYL